MPAEMSSTEMFQDEKEGMPLPNKVSSRECAEGGRSSDNATNAKEEDAPGNQDVDQDEKEGTPLPNKASEVWHIDDDIDESSPPLVRGKSPIGHSTMTW